jgi:hypothetical protein
LPVFSLLIEPHGGKLHGLMNGKTAFRFEAASKCLPPALRVGPLP